MRIGYDATPAILQRAGVGRYARELLRSLVTLDVQDTFLLAAATGANEAAELLRILPPGAVREIRRIPMPDRTSRILWQRAHLPLRIERFTGPLDIFHGTDFVLPPTRAATVVTVHDLSFRVAPQFAEPSLVAYLDHAVPRAISSATRIIAVSASVANEIVGAFPAARDRVVAVPNGVRAAASSPPPAPSGDSRPTMLMVGTVEPRKNHQSFIEAARIVRQRIPEARFVIAGRVGWRADDIMRDITLAQHAGAVEFVDSPDDDALERLYGQSAIAVLPSFYEGFGLPVLEAMSRGIAVVASDIAAHLEVGGNTVRYADPASGEAFAAQIIALLDDPSGCAALVSRARKRAAAYSWDESARRTRRVYQTAHAEGAR